MFGYYSVGSYQVHGKLLACSMEFICFQHGTQNSSQIGVIDIKNVGKIAKINSILCEKITDMDFSPFTANLLATSSRNKTVSQIKMFIEFKMLFYTVLYIVHVY